jgi:ribosomal protein L11 methyltransferase
MTTVKPPPEDLVIYEVAGVLAGDHPPELGPGFLGFWVEAGYTFFFFDREAEAEVGALLTDCSGLGLRHVHRLKYHQWQDGAGFEAFEIGPLTIVPAWPEPTDLSEAGLIRIDPGLAFGFGGHPTTRACLKALVRVFREDRPLQVLDLGTGTGVLALAAARLGATGIRAVEYSHLAWDQARKNVALNRLDQTVEVIQGLAEDHLDFPAELVCSNLHFQVQQEIIRRRGFQGRRWLILSGLFHGQADLIQAALTSAGFTLFDLDRDERWTTLVLRQSRESRGRQHGPTPRFK